MNKVKRLLLLLVFPLFNACESVQPPPSDPEKINKEITYEFDSYDQVGWLKTSAYTEKIAFNESLNFLYGAAFSKTNKLLSIQVYLELQATDWYFINSISDENGSSYKLKRLDRNVDNGIKESFALVLTRPLLEQLAKSDTNFKLRGKRKSVIFTLPKSISKTFLDRVDQQLQLILEYE